jgi:hypothetical protein
MLPVYLLVAVLQSQASKAPVMPYVDHGACPFECCTYGDWTSDAALSAAGWYEGTEARKTIFRIAKGERITGMTGVVIVRTPGIARVVEPMSLEVYSRRFPKAPRETVHFNPGDTIQLFTPQGEGAMSAWFNGRLLEAIDTGDFKSRANIDQQPTYEWWAKVRNSRGQFGWVRIDGKSPTFSGVDACGPPARAARALRYR